MALPRKFVIAAVGTLILVVGLLVLYPEVVNIAIERCRCAYGMVIGDSVRLCNEKVDIKSSCPLSVSDALNTCSSWVPPSLTEDWKLPKNPVTWLYQHVWKPCFSTISNAFWRSCDYVSNILPKKSA